MKRKLASALAAIAISGCASEPVAIGTLPPIANAANSGEVAVIRARAFIDEGFSYYLSVDRVTVLALESGEHTRFRLPAGEHRIAIRCFGALTGTWNETAITRRVAAGQTIFLAVAPKFDCASVEPVPESEGRKLVSRTAFRPI